MGEGQRVGADPAPIAGDRLIAGSQAVLKLVQAREWLDPPSNRLVDEWWNASDDEIDAVWSTRGKVTFRVRLQLGFMHAQRLALDAVESGSSESLDRSRTSLVMSLWHVARDQQEEPDAADAALAACVHLMQGVRSPMTLKLKAQARQRGVGVAKEHPALRQSLGVEWQELIELAGIVRRGIATAADPVFTMPPRPVSTAESLMQIDEEYESDVEQPDYDISGRERKVQSVSFDGFRGSPGEFTIEFVRRGSPASVLLLGDNGSGKSTIVDAVEFCLQGRIGRSVAFNSPLGPSAESFAADSMPLSIVELDDGSSIARELTRLEDGHLAPMGPAVSPGFRLAPVTLKRQDILRFLDTDALSRGHVFFDYFPATADEMAIRPEEELQMLEFESYELRIERKRHAQALSDSLGTSQYDLEKRDQVLLALKDTVLDGQPLHKAQNDGTWETVSDEVRKPAESLLAVQQRLSAIKKEFARGAQTLNPVRYKAQAGLLADALEGIGHALTAAFREITGATYVERIDVVFGRSGPVALDVVVELAGGRRCFPQQVFSEGFRDLLAILFFAMVAQKATEHGQAKVLILDDVFQSVDASIRTGTVDYLLTNFRDWQLVVTVHDRLWFEQLRTLFRRHGHPFVEHELRRWGFESGLDLSSDGAAIDRPLRRALEDADPGTICSAAGRLLEQISDSLSWRLGVSVTRRAGDRYSLGDLWPPVRKRLSKSAATPEAQAVDRVYQLRNLVGAHYNEWAQSLSLSEADEFGAAVLDLFGAVRCSDCNDWIRGTGPIASCPGGHLSV